MLRFASALRRVLLTMAVVVATAPAAAGQSAAAHELRAAFTLNFARFTTWPPMPAGHPLVMCVAGDGRVAAALTAAARDQVLDGRKVEVVELSGPAAIDGCQVLFVGREASIRMAPALTAARTRPILTVSDREGFARETGIIELFVEGGRMRFSINTRTAGRAGLLISSRLLQLAKVVYGTPSL